MYEIVTQAWQVFRHALMITGFVAVMMLLIEYANVMTQGVLMRALGRGRLRQYLLGAILGAIPGCLGAFVIVNLYSHRCITIGALVAAMIATMGDETFVMLAMVPETSLWMIPALVALGVPAGWLTDTLLPRHLAPLPACQQEKLPLHDEEHGVWIPLARLVEQWRSPSPHRAILAVVLAVFAAGVAVGQVGPAEWNWIRVTLLVVTLFGLFVVCTVSDHFLDDHLWSHVFARHVPRILVWTLGTLAVLHVLEQFYDTGELVRANAWFVLGVAVAVGVVPESGPHLAFVTLFAAGDLPLSILLASSIVQDGHGMIPLLAHSRRDFLMVKGINVIFGAAIGAALMASGI